MMMRASSRRPGRRRPPRALLGVTRPFLSPRERVEMLCASRLASSEGNDPHGRETDPRRRCGGSHRKKLFQILRARTRVDSNAKKTLTERSVGQFPPRGPRRAWRAHHAAPERSTPLADTCAHTRTHVVAFRRAHRPRRASASRFPRHARERASTRAHLPRPRRVERVCFVPTFEPFEPASRDEVEPRVVEPNQ